MIFFSSLIDFRMFHKYLTTQGLIIDIEIVAELFSRMRVIAYCTQNENSSHRKNQKIVFHFSLISNDVTVF